MGEKTKKAVERSRKEKVYKEKMSKKEKQAKYVQKKEKKAKEIAAKKENAAKKLKEQAAKAEKAKKEKAKKHKKEQAAKAEKAQKEKTKKEKATKESAAKAEKRQKEKQLKEKKSKEKAKKAEKATKEAAEKYKAPERIKAVAKIVTSLTKTKTKACKAEKKAQEIAKKAKAKLVKARKNSKIAGPGFKFGKDPCKSGSNTFTQKLVLNQRVNVGIIPAGKVNVKIALNTDKDVDTELWTADGGNAVVAWQCKRYQKKRLKAKCIDSFSKISQKWKDITIKYSGYMPKNGQFGKEYIHIVGKSKHAFMIRAFAYEAGTAKVRYSWDKDPKVCKAFKKEKSEKAALKRQLENYKSLSNEKISQMLKVVKSCKVASSALVKIKAKLSVSKKKFQKIEVSYKKCEAKKKAHMAKMKKMKGPIMKTKRM